MRGTGVVRPRRERLPYRRALDAIRSALQSAGVMFIEQNGGEPGVRLRMALTPRVARLASIGERPQRLRKI